MVNLSLLGSTPEVPTFPPQHAFEKSPRDYYITILLQPLENLEALIQLRLNWRVL